MMTNELLRRYAADGSESAFTELVRQHIDLVYSAALRQVNGDAGAAQDVTQTVFTDLARKASRLTGHASLTGWLYTSVRFQAAKSRRAEQRRHSREQESHAMNQLLQTNDEENAWHDLRPVLDDVMHDLSAADREALLLRYFERKPLAEVGAQLGLSDNAARMRVERALDKLRAELSKRGITSTAAALALALTGHAVSAAPVALVAEVSGTALASAAVGGGLTSGILTLFRPTALKWAIGVGALATVSALLWSRHAQSSASIPIPTAVVSQSPTTNAYLATPPNSSNADVAPPIDSTNKLVLHIVTADSGKPVPAVAFEYWLWADGKFQIRKTIQGDRFGLCEVPVPRGQVINRFILVSEKDGLADTRLQWHPDQGEQIPLEYTLRLARSALIGGLVVDADGRPVSGATIGFNNRNDPSTAGADIDTELLTETADFSWPFWIETTSDSAGHWQINRIAKATIHTIVGQAGHPEHVGNEVSVGKSSEAESQLLAGTYVFRLGRAVGVYGDVADGSGKPVSGVEVFVGNRASGPRRAKSRADGKFSISGCRPESTTLTCEAKGFAPLTVAVDLTTNTGPYHLTLQPGNLLRLRVVDEKGQAVPKASVVLNPFPRLGDEHPNQANFDEQTDDGGRVGWDSAPDGDLTFGVSAEGHQPRDFKCRADGQEHLITLSPALTLHGSVTDAATSRSIPAFRIIVGWPETNIVTGEMIPHWSTLDRFWLKFQGGIFRHVFAEPARGGQPSPGFIFKFEAEGYAPFITRTFGSTESEARMDVALRPATPINITMLLPNGQPAVKAEVGLVSAGSGLKLRPGGFSHQNLQSAETLLVADETGHFPLMVDDNVNHIVIAHPDGFGEATPAALSTNTTIQLQPWSRLEGTLTLDGKPAPGRELQLQFRDGNYQSISSDSDAYKATTDASGHFTIAQAPPGRDKLVLVVPLDVGPVHRGWQLVTLTNLDLPPGETLTVTPTTTIPGGTH